MFMGLPMFPRLRAIRTEHHLRVVVEVQNERAACGYFYSRVCERARLLRLLDHCFTSRLGDVNGRVKAAWFYLLYVF